MAASRGREGSAMSRLYHGRPHGLEDDELARPAGVKVGSLRTGRGPAPEGTAGTDRNTWEGSKIEGARKGDPSMKIRMTTIAAGVALAMVPGLALGQKLGESLKVEVEFDHSADFSAYKTFAWAPFQDPAPNPANHVRVTRAVEHELEAKGFTKVGPEQAGVFVRYQGRLDKKIKGTTSQTESPWKANNMNTVVTFDLKKAKVGTLILELWDGHTKDLVWQARESMSMPPADRMEDEINKSVRRLMSQYPPTAAPPARE
jgi:hypothetical protein